MKITRVESIVLTLPMVIDGATPMLGGRARTAIDMLLVRIDTDAGITGWGEAFGHRIFPATRAAIDTLLGPLCVGRDPSQILALNDEIQRVLHGVGRNGPTMYALSGIDIALWDIAGKVAGLPLYRLLGGSTRADLPAYASLLRYGTAAAVTHYTAQALERGYRHIKLHEITVPEVKAARDVAGAAVPIMLDTNCPWTVAQAIEMARRLAPLDLHWLEEPVWPPENLAGLAEVRTRGGIPTAAGENYGTVWEFRRAFEAGAITYAQPSVTKIGGVTELRRVMTLAETSGVQVVPHSAYFGPGLLASIHCIAAMPTESLVERFYCDFAENPLGEAIHPQRGRIAVPQGPGPRDGPRRPAHREAPDGVIVRMVDLAAARRVILGGIRVTGHERNPMTAETAPAAAPSPLDVARALAPRIRARADEIEAARQLPADLVMEIASAGLFKVAVAEAAGGLGADILTALHVIEEVARADGSTGWCLAMGVNTFRQSAQFSPEVRRLMFHSDPIGVSAGSANPRGRAVAVPGGYRVTGHWFFASGCMHSSSLHGACKVFDGDAPRRLPNGDQEVRIAYFYPKAGARILDTWNVSGMRGTGSHDIEADELFVPDEHTFSALERRTRVTGPINRIHGFDLAGCAFACVGLGVARAAIDGLVELASAKVPRSSSDLLRERAAAQARVAEAEALLRSGRAYLFDVVREMWDTVLATRPITERQRSDLRLAMTHAAQSAAKATHLVCETAGTTSIFTGHPLERYARDAEVVTRHNQLQFVNYEAVGRTLFGLESNSPLF